MAVFGMVRGGTGGGDITCKCGKTTTSLSDVTVNNYLTEDVGFQPSYIAFCIRNTTTYGTMLTYENGTATMYYYHNNQEVEQDITSNNLIEVTSTGFKLVRNSASWTRAYYMAIK